MIVRSTTSMHPCGYDRKNRGKHNRYRAVRCMWGRVYCVVYTEYIEYIATVIYDEYMMRPMSYI